MYTACFVCNREFRRNSLIAHCPLGNRIAFEPATGRLWIVCHRCGQWCLVPLEQRWEAIQECEARFRDAPARVSTGQVGVADLGELTLLRIGEALRDEIANWRYGPRFRRRHRRRVIAYSVVVALMATLFSVLAFLGGSTYIAMYMGALFLAFAIGLRMNQPAGWMRLGRVRLGAKKRTLRRWDLPNIAFKRDRNRGDVAIRITVGGDDVLLTGNPAMEFLGTILPRINRDGAAEEDIREATRLVDSAESERPKPKPAKRVAGRRVPALPEPVWQRLAVSSPLSRIVTVRLLALEMAVLEEQEQQGMAEEAARLAPVAMSEAEIGKIADNLFTPAHIAARLERLRNESRDAQEASEGEDA